MFDKVVIIGTGLIGGSLGLDLRKKHLAGQVIGLSRKKKNANLAQKSGAIDFVGSSLDAVKDADLVVLAVPVDVIMDTAAKIANKLKNDCIVIDVGSSKERIVSRLSGLIPNFLGCHPLAGSEKRGAANLKSGIFNGSVCVITPAPKTDKKTLAKIKLLWQKLGANVVILSAKRHDQILAFTSHLPHTLAFSLIGSIPDRFLSLSSGGLKDTTRIAASDADLWSQIFLSNRDNLFAALSSFQAKLDALKLALKNKDKKILTKILASAQKKRNKLG